MDQASGGEDPNKPSKKKSSEDEGRNKKLVGVRAGFLGTGLQRSAALCNPTSTIYSVLNSLKVATSPLVVTLITILIFVKQIY